MTTRRRRALGQHFLADRAALARIVRALEPTDGEALLEIGPGRGALTALLLARLERIAAVEIDPRLAAGLRARFPPERLLLLETDVLQLDLGALARRLGDGQPAPLVLVGNLPYSISKPIVQKLVRERQQIERAVLMFQREVAARLTAAPGTRAYGPLGVLAGAAFEIRPLFDLPPRAFRPAPRVDSRVTAWRRLPGPELAPAEEARLRACLRACFASRRRTLQNNLRAALGEPRAAEALLATAGVSGGLRAEQVDPAGFRRLAAAWPGPPATAHR